MSENEDKNQVTLDRSGKMKKKKQRRIDNEESMLALVNHLIVDANLDGTAFRASCESLNPPPVGGSLDAETEATHE